jgi:aryl-alcohol dehydrogenase-like predicted oxidoreductase
MKQYPVDFVQFPYSIGSRDAEMELLPLAIERKIAVTLDVPLRGLQAALKQPLPPWAADIDVTSWSQFMLKYAISHPGVTCACPGSTKVEHLIDNQLACRGRLPDAAMRKKMEEYWDAKVGNGRA